MREKDLGNYFDLLSMLIQARDEETGNSMTDDQLRTQLLTFLMAGHETTATALSWTWYLLARHAAIRQEVREEAHRALGTSLAIDEVPQLPITRQVIEESLRMYPPVWVVPRQAVTDDEIGGYRIPRGSTILLLPYVTHRHPDVWQDPDNFVPGRFTPEMIQQRPKGAYFPFLGGAHQCIGNEFAMVEMQLVVSMVLRQFDLQLLPNQRVEPEASITLRPTGRLQMMLSRVDRATMQPAY